MREIRGDLLANFLVCITLVIIMADIYQLSIILTPKSNKNKQRNHTPKNSPIPFNTAFAKSSPIQFKPSRITKSPHQSPRNIQQFVVTDSPKTKNASPNCKVGGLIFGTPVRKLTEESPAKTTAFAKSKPKTYDRFIPNRNTMDMATSQFQIASHKEGNNRNQFLDTSTIAYQEEVARACGVALDKRILAFSAEAPPSQTSTKQLIKQSWNRPLKHTTRRKIAQAPEKVLDAPGLLDDYYLNLLDWSSQNILAIALDKNVYVWNADSGDVHDFCSTEDDDYVSSLQFTADGSFLAVGTFHGDTQIFDVGANSKLRTLKGHSSRVSVLSWDKHIVSSGARDGNIFNHDVRVQNHKVAHLAGHTAEICGLKWRPDGQLLASGGNDNLVNIWDARSSTPKYTFDQHTAAVKAIAWCPWQLNLLSTGGGSFDRHIHFWNTAAGSKTSSIDTGSQVTSIVWSRQYKEFISSHGFPNNHLSIWSYPTLNKITDLPGHDSRVLHTAISPDGQTVASAASDENLKFWKCFESKRGGNASKLGAMSNNDDELINATRRLAIR